MARWLNENAFDDAVRTAHGAFPSVPVDVIKGVIATESGFNDRAIRGEPQRGDASYGLMQLLLATARGLGYGGTTENLLLPAINVYYGTKLLDQLYRQTGNWPDAISAYNGGMRPSLGFGKRATTPGRVCLRWNPVLTGQCDAWHSYKAGEYANQAHVDRAMGNIAYFGGRVLAPAGVGPPTPFPVPFLPVSAPAPTIAGLAGGGTVTLLLLAGLVLMGVRERRRAA